MIQIEKTFQINVGSSLGFSFSFQSDSDCISFSNPSNTINSSTGTINCVLSFQDSQECFDSEITLTINSFCGRQKTYTFKEPYPCSTSSVTIANTPSQDNIFVFTASTTNLTFPVTYSWTYDTNLFNAVGSINSQTLTLTPKAEVPTQTIVSVDVNDSRGCNIRKELNFSICKPKVFNISQTLTCLNQYNTICPGAIATSPSIRILYEACSGTSIDWTTLNIIQNNNFCIKSSSIGNNNYVNFYAKTGTSSGTYSFTYTVKNNFGIESDPATITLTLPNCSTPRAEPKVSILNFDVELEASTSDLDIFSVTTGDDIFIRLEDKVFPSEDVTIDWDSFTFIASTGQTLVSADELTTSNGTATYTCGSRMIKYTLGTKTENVDLIKFKIADTDGNYSNTARWTIDWEAIGAPTASNDSVTVECGTPKIIDVLANDTGDLIPTTVEIVTPPTSSSTAIVNADGTITYTSTEAGAQSFTYRVKNANDVWSNNATVNVTSNCAGTGLTVQICPGSASEDLTSFLTGSISAGGAWTQDPGNPSSVTLTDPTDVDFNSANAGTYLFFYTVGLSVATVTVVIPTHSVTITSASQGTSNPFQAPTTPQSTVIFETVGVDNINNITITVELSATVIGTYTPDSWQNNLGQVRVALDGGAGTYTVTVEGTTICGVKESDSVMITI